MVKLALFLELHERLHGILKRHVTGHPRRLKQIDLFGPAEGRVDGIDAAPQVLWAKYIRQWGVYGDAFVPVYELTRNPGTGS